ncbi:MAG TPA: hypothetical protein VGX72_10690 [Solirubrobacteraceae bacterium]|nr:hypothetical protein [Solirubrobacteraceae bacterium]
MTDFLDEKRQEITNRLKELKPLVDEYSRLEAAAAALAGVGGSTSSSSSAITAVTTRRRGPGRPKGSSTRKKAAATTATAAVAAPKAPGKPGRPAKRRAGRRKGSGTRAAEARSFVQGQPGITIPELAAKMGIKQNYLYRVLPGLEQENKVEKKGRGWYPKG